MRKMLTLIASMGIYMLHAQVTIENLLSVPFPTELCSSADGKHIAWVFNDKGMRNVFIADAPAFAARKVTSHTTDDGIDIGGLSFSAGGNYLFFTEGNSLNGSGEAANPALLQNKTNQNVWVVHTDGTGLHKIGAGSGAIASPDNARVYYTSHSNAWSASLTDTSAPAQLFEARGGINSLRFSPDGKLLAFVSNRGDHAFVGLYNLADKTVSYPDASVDIDLQPVFSPDGKWLAYLRVPNVKDRLPFVEERTGSPWSIRLLNVSTSMAHELWHADEGVGSVFNGEFPVADNMLLWGAGDNIVFPWEKDGWQHLYSINAAKGSTPKLLTPGDGEVENMYLTPDGSSIVYNTNIGDSHRRHIYKADVGGNNKPMQLTTGEGIEWGAANTAQGIALIQSTATTPGWPCLLKSDGNMQKLVPEMFPSAFPASQLVTPKLVSFAAKDGMKIYGQLFMPPNYQPGKKYPALLFFHGGSRRQMLLGFHYMDYYNNDYAMNQYYASRGYLVLAVNYRSGIGYGMAFREALNYGANGASEYNDVIGAGLYMRNRPDVDIKRIGLWGGSYGGFLTAMGLARNSDVFAFGVDIHGVHNWSDEMRTWVADYDPSTRVAFANKAVASSPVHFVDGWKSPVLFIHGDDDRNVPFSQTVNIIEKLRQRKVYFEQLIIPDEIHDFLLHKTWIQGYHAAADFFDRMMKRVAE